MAGRFRFGVITNSAPDARSWRERARRAEGLGYTSLLMPDHFQPQWSPLVALAVAAEATERLAVGTLVFCNDYRHPLVLAREIATLDQVSGGRVEFGLGAGWKQVDYDATGLACDSPGTRIARMGEALQIMKALWSSEAPVDFAGRHYRLRGALGTPRPVSRPHPRICIGGGGRRILSLAAREADIVSLNATLRGGRLGAGEGFTATASAFDEKIAWVREAAGARFASLELQCHCPFVAVTPKRDASLEAIARQLSIPLSEASELPLALVGSVEELCETLERRRERWGFGYTVIPGDAMEAFAPVVARLG